MEEEKKVEGQEPETKEPEKVEEKEPEKKEDKPEEKVDEKEKEKEEEKPEKKPTKKKEKAEEVDVDKLQKELKKATDKIAKLEEANNTIETMKKDAEKKDAVIQEYEQLLTNLVDTKIKQLPDKYKDLLPDNLDLKQKLSWLDKAEEKGLFKVEEKKNPNIEIGKPMNIEPPKVDTSKLTGSQLLKMAYNTIAK